MADDKTISELPQTSGLVDADLFYVLHNSADNSIKWSDLKAAVAFGGVLPIANGGTNSSTTLNNNRLICSKSDKIAEAAALTDGQIFIGNTGSLPAAAFITGTAMQVNVVSSSGSIVLSTPQNISTDSTPTFQGLKFGSLGDILNAYTYTTLTTTMSGPWGAAQPLTINLMRIGNWGFASFHVSTEVANTSSAIFADEALPIGYVPSIEQNGMGIGKDDDIICHAYITITIAGNIIIEKFKDSTGPSHFTGSGLTGVMPFVLTYKIS
jgi:hypothetical protein